MAYLSLIVYVIHIPMLTYMFESFHLGRSLYLHSRYSNSVRHHSRKICMAIVAKYNKMQRRVSFRMLAEGIHDPKDFDIL